MEDINNKKDYEVEDQYEFHDFSDDSYNSDEQGRGAAIASMVLGIVSVVFWFLGVGAIIGLITGIIGIICSSNSKKAGYRGGMQTAGFVCSVVGTVGSGLIFVSCLALVGTVGTLSLFAD